jgi:hypothetical protein
VALDGASPRRSRCRAGGSTWHVPAPVPMQRLKSRPRSLANEVGAGRLPLVPRRAWRALRSSYTAPCVRRGHVITAIDKSSPESAGMMARPVIHVRSISAAVVSRRPKLAHEASQPRGRSTGFPRLGHSWLRWFVRGRAPAPCGAILRWRAAVTNVGLCWDRISAAASAIDRAIAVVAVRD